MEGFVEIKGIIQQITDRSILINFKGEEIWIPISQIKEVDEWEKGDQALFNIPIWLAFEKGIL